MVDDIIHLQRDPVSRNHNIFLLFIPIIIFALLVAFLFSLYSKGQIAGIPKPEPVLGTQVGN
jgi:hypothetical protein